MNLVRAALVGLLMSCSSGCFLLFGSDDDEATAKKKQTPVLVMRPATSDKDPTQPRATLGPVAPTKAAVAMRGEAKPVDLSDMIGRVCSIHFRRDALGLPTPGPQSEWLPSKVSTAMGVLVKVSDEWLVLDSGGNTRWIPRNVVLEIEFQPTTPAGASAQ
jgi:hypothetical protein